MNIDNLHPYADVHAVQTVIFAIEWPEPLGAETIISATKLAAKFKNLGLPLHANQNTVAIEIGAQTVNSAMNHEPSGIVFSAEPLNNGKIGRQVSLSRQNCMIVIPDYTRWNKVIIDAQKYLKVILDVVAPMRAITTVGLQYNDILVWQADPSELNLKDIFKSDSYIPAHAFDCGNLWHVHHGYIKESSTPIKHSIIENVNVDTTDSTVGRTFQIIGSHRATLNEPLWQTHLKNENVLIELFDSLHNANKLMLKSLLTDDVCRKISLMMP